MTQIREDCFDNQVGYIYLYEFAVPFMQIKYPPHNVCELCNLLPYFFVAFYIGFRGNLSPWQTLHCSFVRPIETRALSSPLLSCEPLLLNIIIIAARAYSVFHVCNHSCFLCGVKQSPIDRSHTFDIYHFTIASALVNRYIFSLRPHSEPGAALPAAAAVPLRSLHPDAPRAAGAEGRDVRPHQHRDGHRVRLSLPERRGPRRGEGEGQRDGGRVGLGKRGGVSPPAIFPALPRAQHRRPAGHPGVCRHSTG